MTAKLTKTIAGLAASLAILGGQALGQDNHAAPQNADFLLQALYAQMDGAREDTTKLVLAKAESDVRMTLLRTNALYAYRTNLNSRFVLAHLEP
jgi:hypothetical protein